CIISTLAIATVFGGAAPAVPIHDAVKRVDDKGRLIDHLDRTGMVGIQTPQAFRFQAILAAHRQVASSGKVYRDDTEIFTDYGGIVGTSEGEVKNRKITLMQDLTESGVR
ncbi:MAG: 2-C-methyl-D-erythritol 4-phosphate cytidylyltransferase, partial [Sphaerochaetaceae bacterium]|nr:2-C-methyl-D-erythritol 4-phosphate cytidylyltransferase [Sphaerochaetaceae bacterium]